MPKLKTIEGYEIWASAGYVYVYDPDGKRIGYPSGSLSRGIQIVKAELKKKEKLNERETV